MASRESTKIPDRWFAYTNVGDVIIPGTPRTQFITFKTPLNESYFDRRTPKDKRFTPTTLLECMRDRELKLGLVIDLTNTNRYYDKKEFTTKGVKYKKIWVEGCDTPSEKVIESFYKTIDKFRKTSKEEKEKAEGIMKKKAKRDKKNEKHKKKTLANAVSKAEGVAETLAQKHTRDDNDMECSSMKPKKQKVQHGMKPMALNHIDNSVSSDSEMSLEPEDIPSKPSVRSEPTKNIPAKPLKKKGAQKKTKHAQSEACADKNNTDGNTETEMLVSPVAMTSDLSETDMLQAASINSIEDKREKLRAKIAELQAKRKPTNKERLEKKKLRRQESKMKLKQKRKSEKLHKKENSEKGAASKPNKGNLNKGATTPVKPIYNKEGQMVYSKFDFTDSAKKEKAHNDLSGKDYKRLLEKIEKRNEKINKVKSKDESAGKALEEKFKWESVLHKAEGAKVKDNPEMLKKSMKRKQKVKDQKKKKWENRAENVEKMKDEKQKKRTENIQKRKQNVKDKKIKKLKKKGRILPGF